MSSLPGEQAALRCYLNTIVALAKCMRQICPQTGLAYQDRLLRLPRGLGADATPQAIERTYKALEADLAEFAEMASTWVNQEANHAKQVLAQAGLAADSIVHSGELHAAMLDDLAEHMQTSAEVDGESEVRASLVRYAAGLRAYAKRKKQEDLSVLEELRRATNELEAWLLLANRSQTVDAGTGLLNRPEALKQLQARLETGQRFCVLRVEWVEASSIPPQFGKSGVEQIIQQLGERLITLVQTDGTVVYHWGEGRYLVLLQEREKDSAYASDIAGSLSGAYTAVVDGVSWNAKVGVTAALFESEPGETVADLVQRIDTVEESVVLDQ